MAAEIEWPMIREATEESDGADAKDRMDELKSETREARRMADGRAQRRNLKLTRMTNREQQNSHDEDWFT
jgi:hypothetical protein